MTGHEINYSTHFTLMKPEINQLNKD